MYLEERVEQLEHIAVDQGRQIESIAKGLAELTTDVRAIRQDMNAGFEQINARFEQVDARFEQVDARFDTLTNQVNTRFEQVDVQLDDIRQTQRLMLKLLEERLK